MNHFFDPQAHAAALRQEAAFGRLARQAAPERRWGWLSRWRFWLPGPAKTL